MSVKYDQETKAKAIRLVREHAGDYPSEYAAITAVARRLGMTAETLRKWVRQAEIDEGQAPGVSSEAAREIRELSPQEPRAGADCRDPQGGHEFLRAGAQPAAPSPRFEPHPKAPCWAGKDHRLLASQGAVDPLDLQLADGGLPSLFFVTTLSLASSSTQVSKIYDY